MGIQSALTPLGNGMSFLCGRLSYTFGFHGICTAVDTACSSSLVAAHVAVLHMCDTSSSCVIGGGDGMFLGYTTAMLGTIGALALSGRCKSFSQDADGFGRGEGYMAIGCARVSDSNQLSKAVCVAATSVNHDGNSSSLTAPHGPTQRSLLLGCRERSGFKHLEALSSHGTGTTLGDPIEANAIVQSLTSNSPDLPKTCTLIASKSFYGHTESTAGLTGLLSAMIPMTSFVSFTTKILSLNPIAASTFDNATDLSLSIPRSTLGNNVEVSGTSSFGMSGVNSHAILSSTVLVSGRADLIFEKRDMRCIAVTSPNYRQAAVSRQSVTFTFPLKSRAADLHHHKIQDRCIFPAASFLEGISSIQGTLLGTMNGNSGKDVVFLSPILLGGQEYLTFKVELLGEPRVSCSRPGHGPSFVGRLEKAYLRDGASEGGPAKEKAASLWEASSSFSKGSDFVFAEARRPTSSCASASFSACVVDSMLHSVGSVQVGKSSGSGSVPTGVKAFVCVRQISGNTLRLRCDIGEGHEGNEGHEGHEEEGSNEGNEGHEGNGCNESHEGHEEEKGHEGHEGHEGRSCHEGHEGHEEEGSYESNESYESNGCYESNEGHEEEESYESDESHESNGCYESHEGHEEEKGHEGDEGHEGRS